MRLAAGILALILMVFLVQNQGTKFDLTGAPPDRSRRRLPCDRSRRLRLLQTMSSETALGIQSLLIYAGTGITGQAKLSEAAAMGLLGSFLFLLGGAFAFKLPTVSAVIFGLAALD